MNTEHHSMAEHFVANFAFNASLTFLNLFNSFPLVLNNLNIHFCSSSTSAIMPLAMNVNFRFGRGNVITMSTLKCKRISMIANSGLPIQWLLKFRNFNKSISMWTITLKGLAPIWTVRLWDIAMARELNNLPQILQGVEEVGRWALKMCELSRDLWWNTFPHCSHTWLPPASCLHAIWT